MPNKTSSIIEKKKNRFQSQKEDKEGSFINKTTYNDSYYLETMDRNNNLSVAISEILE